jgi:ketosteroid isomerase-like protein
LDVVERYLDRLVAHDWDGMAACLTTDVVRIGPFGDTYTPRDRYVAFLSDLMPQLTNYSMKVTRVTYGDRVAVAELSETLDVDGEPLETPEAIVFDLDDAGQIAHIAIYIQRQD